MFCCGTVKNCYDPDVSIHPNNTLDFLHDFHCHYIRYGFSSGNCIVILFRNSHRGTISNPQQGKWRTPPRLFPIQRYPSLGRKSYASHHAACANRSVPMKRHLSFGFVVAIMVVLLAATLVSLGASIAKLFGWY